MHQKAQKEKFPAQAGGREGLPKAGAIACGRPEQPRPAQVSGRAAIDISNAGFKEQLLLPLSFPNAAGEGCNRDLKCRESFQSSVRTCSISEGKSHRKRKVISPSASFKQLRAWFPVRILQSPLHSGTSHQLLTAIKVWVSSQCLCCAWNYAAFTERTKTKPKLKCKDLFLQVW